MINLPQQSDYFRAQMEHCMLCPRECGVNRSSGQLGFCRAGDRARVASRCLHRGEEPPISGSRGSGTIFFSGCSMRCVYCQNYPISQLGYGRPVEPSELADTMLELQGRGAHNINLVTATHFLPQTVEAIREARTRGLDIPVASNTSGYERVETVRMLEGLVQIYMVDMRYSRSETAARYSQAPEYPEVNRSAVLEMIAQVGPLECRDTLAVGGVLVRHLLLPGLLEETREILAFLASHAPETVPVSIMTQYFPANKAYDLPGINRTIVSSEYEAALRLLEEFGINEGWIQDPHASTEPIA
jgi:putative pyruvate formate lyase activating enzyme